MQNVLLAKGHGYENHSTQGRCTAFDGFEVIANPLGGYDREDRESRVAWRDLSPEAKRAVVRYLAGAM